MSNKRNKRARISVADFLLFVQLFMSAGKLSFIYVFVVFLFVVVCEIGDHSSVSLPNCCRLYGWDRPFELVVCCRLPFHYSSLFTYFFVFNFCHRLKKRGQK